jgi:hypothetical protein
MKTEIKPGAFSMFINPKIECQLENGPTIRATGQAIVYQTKNDGWEADLELVDIDEIVFMGVSITDHKKLKASIDHFKSMGIDLFDIAQYEFEEMVRMSGTTENFVFDQTGIDLK